MIYAKHDFTTNFCNAVGYEDSFMLQDIIFDEIAKLIVDNKKDVVNLLRDEGLDVSVNDNNEIIKNRLVNEILKQNQNVIKGISQMIVKNKFDAGQYKSILGIGKKAKAKRLARQKLKTLKESVSPEKKTKEGKFWGKLKSLMQTEQAQEGAANLIALGVQRSFNKQSPKTTAANNELLSERLKTNEMHQAARRRKKIGTGAIIILIVAAAGLITVGTLAIVKARKSD